MSDEEQPQFAWNDTPTRLRKALKQDEFVLFCQPILALRGAGGFALAEVLIRQHEEEQALLPPGEFLPLFEEHQMLPLLDRWVLVRVLQRLGAGCRVPRLAMNVAGQTLLDEEFPGFFAESVKRSKIPPASIVFEIDENDLVGRPQAVKRFAERIRASGGGLAVSGFGRRLDSFEALEALRPDFVKVDGSITLKITKSLHQRRHAQGGAAHGRVAAHRRGRRVRRGAGRPAAAGRARRGLRPGLRRGDAAPARASFAPLQGGGRRLRPG